MFAHDHMIYRGVVTNNTSTSCVSAKSKVSFRSSSQTSLEFLIFETGLFIFWLGFNIILELVKLFNDIFVVIVCLYSVSAKCGDLNWGRKK